METYFFIGAGCLIMFNLVILWALVASFKLPKDYPTGE